MRRMHLLLGGLAVLVIASVAIAVTSIDREDEGPFVISPPNHDFGRLMQGEVRSKTFTIKNNTGVDVVLRQFKSSCTACLNVERMPQPLLPRGGETTVTVHLDTGKVPPQQLRKRIEIWTNYGPVPQLFIPISADTFAPYKVNVQALHLGKIDGSKDDFEPRVISVRAEPGFVVAPNANDMWKQGLSSFTHEKFFDVGIETKKDGYDVVLTLRKEALVRPHPPKLKGHLLLKVKWGELSGAASVKNEDWRFDERLVELRGTWAPPPPEKPPGKPK